MKMEVKIPSSSPGAVEFNFDSACTSPYVSAPSTPRLFGNYFFSAPTSPTHFNWEQHQRTPPFSKDFSNTNEQQNPDFEFDFNAQLNAPQPHLSAEELFHGGKIKPININPPESRITESPSSPKRMIFKEGLSKKNDLSGAIRRTPRGQSNTLRVSDILLEEEESSTESSSGFSPSGWCKRWRHLLLFKSKSEGANKDLPKRIDIEEDLKNSSFRSTEVVNSVHNNNNNITQKRKKGKRRVSAHELHYRVNRTVSEEMRRKTFLPYKRSVLLGC
ncbi:hypothetical protein LguiB_007109 [Lonicera macranthoides]